MDEIEKKISNCLRTLSFHEKKSKELATKGGERDLNRHLKTVADLLDKLYHLKITATEAKIVEETLRMTLKPVQLSSIPKLPHLKNPSSI